MNPGMMRWNGTPTQEKTNNAEGKEGGMMQGGRRKSQRLGGVALHNVTVQGRPCASFTDDSQRFAYRAQTTLLTCTDCLHNSSSSCERDSLQRWVTLLRVVQDNTGYYHMQSL